MSDENPFASAEAWDVSESILGPGTHVVKIAEADGSGTTSGGHPQVELRFANAQGAIRDWLAITPASVGKVVALTEACGLPRPGDGDFDQSTYRLAPGYVAKLIGKSCAIVVQQEPDRMDPTKMRDRVKGYKSAQGVGAADNDTSGFGPSSPTGSPGDPDIPF